MRLTAAGFAIVGNFEDAIYCWRKQADKWPNGPAGQPGNGIGIRLVSGAGALGAPKAAVGVLAERAEIGIGDEADVDFMQSAVGLAWRALLLWLLLLLLLGFARLLGA